MWLIGVLSLMLLVALLARVLDRRRDPAPFAADFDLEAVSAAYGLITGPLAGFSVAATVFLANLARVVETSFFEDVMALFVIAFIMLIGTAIIHATFRGARLKALPGHHHEVHCILFIISNLGFFLSLSVSWLGLRPLLLAIELSELAELVKWILLFAVLAGAIRLGAWMRALLGVKLLSSVLIPVLSVAAAALYGLTLEARAPLVWPEANPVLSLAVLVFAVGAFGGAVETAMITFYGDPEFVQRMRRIGNRLIAPYAASAIAAVGLLWYSIASL